MKLLRRLTKSEFRAWKKLEKQLQSEGLGAIDANIAITGWTFAKHGKKPSAGTVQFGEVPDDSPYSSGIDADVQRSAALNGSSSLADIPQAVAVSDVWDAVRKLPSNYKHRALICAWAEHKPGWRQSQAKRLGTGMRQINRIVSLFLEQHGLPNPWSHERNVTVSDGSCTDKHCRTPHKHSEHGPARCLSKREVSALNLPVPGPPRDRTEWLREHARRLAELESDQ
jgi:hypothetical protein